MSVKAMSAAFDAGEEFELPPVQRLILLRLGDWADDYGYTWPGVGDLEAKTGASARTVQRHVRELDEAGLLIIVHPGGGRHRTTLYRILPRQLPDAADAPGKRRYEARFHVTVNPVNLSPFPDPKPRHPARETPSSGARNPVTALSPDPLDPSGSISEEDFILPIERAPGEPWSSFLKRLGSELVESIE